MSSDVIDQLRTFAPDIDDLEQRWPALARDHLAQRIRSDGRTIRPRLVTRPLRRRRRARLIAGSALLAAAVAAGVIVPALLPDGAPGAASPVAAAALHRLARVASSAAIDIAGPGQFVHTITREHQVGIVDDGTNKPSDLTITTEQWEAPDGRLWRQQTASESAPRTFFFPASQSTVSYAASLPTDPVDLRHYLRGHVSGSNSTDEAVFVAVGDLLRDQTASAPLRAAAVTVLAQTDHVSLGPATTDTLGRPAQEFDFIDGSGRPGVVESLFFDPATAELIDERTTSPESTRTTSVVTSHVVSSVPSEILRIAIAQ